jgi:hypothetical protein
MVASCADGKVKGLDDAGTLPGAANVQAQAIGSPGWKPIRVHLFSAPCGTQSSGFGEAVQVVERILPHHHYFAAQNVVGPRTAHDGYADELAAGIKLAGHERDGNEFSSSELASPSCVFVTLMLVPDGSVTGASPDSPAGPVLDPASFPLVIDGNLWSRGQLVDTSFDFLCPGLRQLTPPPSGESYSHLPLVFLVNDALSPALQVGVQELKVKILDAAGVGWRLSIGFVVRA